MVEDLKRTERWSSRSGNQDGVTLDDAVGLLIVLPSLHKARQHPQNPIEQIEKTTVIKSDYVGQTYFAQGDLIEITFVERSEN